LPGRAQLALLSEISPPYCSRKYLLLWGAQNRFHRGQANAIKPTRTSAVSGCHDLIIARIETPHRQGCIPFGVLRL
jgi:hypothetical protein